MSETPSPCLHVPHSAPSPPRGPHRVKGWELEAGHGPFQKELLWRGERQAQVEGKLGARAHIRLGSGWAGGWGGQGQGRASLTRRSAQEKSFFLRPGAQLAGRPAASGTHGGYKPVSTRNLGDRGPQPTCISPADPHISPPPGPYLPQRRCPRWRWARPRWPGEGQVIDNWQ